MSQYLELRVSATPLHSYPKNRLSPQGPQHLVSDGVGIATTMEPGDAIARAALLLGHFMAVHEGRQFGDTGT